MSCGQEMDVFVDCFSFESSLNNILEQKTLKWIFVGGKGGVGKTTCSSSLAIRLAEVRTSVLIISTDPAHNLSDAFDQKLSRMPSKIKGFDNLYAMEVDPSGNFAEISEDYLDENECIFISKSVLQDVVGSLPGMDETISFAEVMKLVQNMNYSVVVFDTAPTGHTLKLLSFPNILEKGLVKVLQLKQMFGPFLNHINRFIPQFNANTLVSNLEDVLSIIKLTNQQFQDKTQTTFICVCIAEYLSICGTERLIQQLIKCNIDTHNIVVNQVVCPPKDTKLCCNLCRSRYNMQSKYLDQIGDLYYDFNITKIPLIENEIRGTDRLWKFSENLIIRYKNNC